MTSLERMKSTLVISLAMTLAVSLTACSTLLDDADLWTVAAKEKEIAAVAPPAAAVEPAKVTPEMPAHVVKCVRDGLAAAAKQKPAVKKVKTLTIDPKAPTAAQGGAVEPSADQLVLAKLKTEEERRKCAAAVLAWYKTLQEANRKAAAGKAKTS